MLRNGAEEKGGNLTPYQGKQRVFGFYRCTQCGKHWKSGGSWANRSQECKSCMIDIYPYRQHPRNKIMRYSCPECKTQWVVVLKDKSKQKKPPMETSKNKKPPMETSKCKKCGTIGNPILDDKKPHQQNLCEKCLELGEYCIKFNVHKNNEPRTKKYHKKKRIIMRIK